MGFRIANNTRVACSVDGNPKPNDPLCPDDLITGSYLRSSTGIHPRCDVLRVWTYGRTRLNRAHLSQSLDFFAGAESHFRMQLACVLNSSAGCLDLR